jgi:YqaJ-like viral recombinase domain
LSNRADAATAEELSDNLIVQLGTATENLNRRWYERNTGHTIKHVQRWIQHPVLKWMAATPDGLVDLSGAVFEAKFMLPWTFSEKGAAEKHMAQLQHNMWAANARHEDPMKPAAPVTNIVRSDNISSYPRGHRFGSTAPAGACLPAVCRAPAIPSYAAIARLALSPYQGDEVRRAVVTSRLLATT